MEKLLIIDGNSILNRAYYGIRPLTTKEGLYTHAVYGMTNIVNKHLEALKPEYAAVAFDLRAPTFRHIQYESYKANRKGMPEELAVQLPYAKDMMRALGIRVLELEGYEADDILGTLSAMAGEAGIESYILTGDRDSLQLIDKNTSVVLVKTNADLKYDEAAFFAEYGIAPRQFVDVKALMGDASDNIPGVAGIGEKTALKLICDFGSLEKIYENLDAPGISQALKTKLENGRESAFLSRELARIERRAPIDCGADGCRYNGILRPELYALACKLEFSGLIKKYGLETEGAATPAAVQVQQLTQEMPPAPAKTDFGSVRRVYTSDVAHLEEFADKGKPYSLAADGGSLCAFDGETLYITELPDTAGEGAREIEKALSCGKIICHDCKALYKKLQLRGIRLRSCLFDTMLAAYVLDANRGAYGLSEVYTRYLESTVPDPELSAAAVYVLWGVLEKLIKESGSEKLLREIETPLAAVLCDMEIKGFKVNAQGIASYGKELEALAARFAERIYMQAGEEFNIGSPKQLGVILFEKLGLPTQKKTKGKTGYSTDVEVLGKLKKYHPVISDILEYRALTKLKNTYADTLIDAVGPDGRIHCFFNQTATATGRISAQDPNLQTIPIKTEQGRRFREFFIPENPDYLIIDADYSQIELRLLAHISGDEAMREAFRNNFDIHTSTASKIFSVPPEAVTLEMRKQAKAINFGILYGMAEFSLSEDLGISLAEAKIYRENYLKSYPEAEKYLENVVKEAYRDGYVTTFFGRKRYIPELTASNKNVKKFGERVAMNSPLQGSAADIIKIAMVNFAREVEKKGLDAAIVLQVHDELLVETRADIAEEVRGLLVDCMQNAVTLTVPLLVDSHIWDSWLSAK